MTRRLAPLILLGLSFALQGCVSDCSISEATGALQTFKESHCSASGTLEGDRGVVLELTNFADVTDLQNLLEVSIRAPLVVGLRGSGLAITRDSSDFLTALGSGAADYVITGLKPREGTRDVIIDVDLSCPKLFTKYGNASLKGHASFTVFNFGP